MNTFYNNHLSVQNYIFTNISETGRGITQMTLKAFTNILLFFHVFFQNELDNFIYTHDQTFCTNLTKNRLIAC